MRMGKVEITKIHCYFTYLKLIKTSSIQSQYIYGNRIILRIKEIINDNTVNVITSKKLKRMLWTAF